MGDDLLERLRRVNPVPQELEALPIEPLLHRLDQQPDGAESDARAVEADRGWSRWFPSLDAVVAISCAIVAIVIGVGALFLVQGHRRSAQQAATPGRQELIDMLAVLRRAQTKADLDPQLLSRLQAHEPLGLALEGTPDVPLVRLATVTGWGAKVFLVPMKPLTAKSLRDALRHVPAQDRPRFNVIRAARKQKTLGVFTTERGTGGGFGGCCTTAATIHGEGTGINGFESLAASTETHSGPNIKDLGSGRTNGYIIVINVVPDGVAKVVFLLAHEAGPIKPGATTHNHTLAVTTRVHDNIAAIRIQRPCCVPAVRTIWYASNGRLFKR